MPPPPQPSETMYVNSGVFGYPEGGTDLFYVGSSFGSVRALPQMTCPGSPVDLLPGQEKACLQTGIQAPYGMVLTDVQIQQPANAEDFQCFDSAGAPWTQGGTIEFGQNVTCYGAIAYANTAETNTYEVVATAVDMATGQTISSSDPLTFLTRVANVQFTKMISGVATQKAPGVLIPSDAEVPVTFLVKNMGDLELTSISVADPTVNNLSCLKDVLAIGEEMTCTATLSPIGPEANYSGTANLTATVTPPSGPTQLTAESTGYAYSASAPKMTVTETVSPLAGPGDLNVSPGPLVMIRRGLDFFVEVTNYGNEALNNVSVASNDPSIYFYAQNGNPYSLAPGETVVFAAQKYPGLDANTEYSHTVTVTAVSANTATPMSAQQTVYVHTDALSLDVGLKKQVWGRSAEGIVGWYDADAVADGIVIIPRQTCEGMDPMGPTPKFAGPTADPILEPMPTNTCFRFIVENNSNTVITEGRIVDDVLSDVILDPIGMESTRGLIRCGGGGGIYMAQPMVSDPVANPTIEPSVWLPLIEPGTNYTCYGSLPTTETSDPHVNNATVTVGSLDPNYSVTNPVFAIPEPPLPHSFTVKKFINGVEAPDKASAVVVENGAVPAFTFEVANTGQAPMTSFQLTDSYFAPDQITCDATSLAPGAKTTCRVLDGAMDPLSYGQLHTNKATVVATFQPYTTRADLVVETLSAQAFATVLPTTVTTTQTETVTSTSVTTEPAVTETVMNTTTSVTTEPAVTATVTESFTADPVTTTLEIPTTVEIPTTLSVPTTIENPVTIVVPTTIDAPPAETITATATVTEQVTAEPVTTTLEIPTTVEIPTTISVPTTIATTLPGTTSEVVITTTLEVPTTIDNPTTIEVPTTIDAPPPVTVTTTVTTPCNCTTITTLPTEPGATETVTVTVVVPEDNVVTTTVTNPEVTVTQTIEPTTTAPGEPVTITVVVPEPETPGTITEVVTTTVTTTVDKPCPDCTSEPPTDVDKPGGSSEGSWWWLLAIPLVAGVIGLIAHFLPQLSPGIRLPAWLGVQNPPPEPVVVTTEQHPELTKGIPPQ
ncbi:hypothetical protein [Corynebacterium sp. H130]|uniref:hypothetical protein n=1 Tax=Corynebacterium sp. H130 TaxID=3133444 RepID=UPI0030A7CFF6